MVRNKIRILIISVLSFIVLACSGLLVTLAFAEVPEFNIVFIEQTLSLNETIEIPKATVSVDGEVANAKHYVEYPDGRINYSENVKLDVVGEYKLVYYTELNGKTYKEDKIFNVKYNNSNDFTLLSGEASFVAEAYSPEYITDAKYQGIAVSAKEGATFVYNKAIDLKDNNKNTQLFQFLWTPATSGLAEFRELFVTLRDCFDENNYVVFHFYSDAAVGYPGSTSLSAYAHCQKVYKNTYKNSLSGTSSGFINGKLAIPTGVILDYSSKQVIGMPAANTTSSPLNITDLDGQLDSLSGGDVWTGFSADLAMMEIKVVGVTGTANFLITSIDGKNFTREANEIIEEEICYGVYNFGYKDMPEGAVGKSYPIPDIIMSSNIYGVLPITKTFVLFNMQESIPINNNRFLTEKAGDYYICYQAVSPLGNSKNVFARVNVNEKDTDKIEYVFDQNIMETINIQEGSIVFYDGEISGGYGELSIEKNVTCNGKKVEIIRAEYDYFNLVEVGTYKLEIKVVDFLNNEKVFTKNINVVSSTENVVFSNPILPQKIVSGTTFVIPKVTAKTNERSLTVKTKINGNEVNDSFTVNNEEQLILEYIAGGQSISYTIDVIKNKENHGFLMDYFDTNAIGSFSSNGIVFENASDFYVNFANYIPVGSLSLSLSAISEKMDFSRIKVLFTDAENLNNSVYVSATKSGNNLVLGVNGKNTEQQISIENILHLTFDNYSKSILLGVSEEKLADVDLCANNTPFNGFNSGYAFISIYVEGVNNNAGIEISKIANQSFYDIEMDETVPLVLAPENVPITQRVLYGGEYTIPNIIGYDVLTGLCLNTVTISCPNYETITGKLVGEKITLNQFGFYYINYAVEDANGCVKQFALTVYVIDTKSPNLTLSEGYVQSAKVGEEVKIANVIVNDNDKIAGVYTYIFNSDGHLVGVPIKDVTGKETVFKFVNKGKYLIRKIAFDTIGNQAYLEYVITVG